MTSWNPPAHDGGAPITGYHLERRMTSSALWVAVTKEPIREQHFKVTSLVESNEYELRVAAENVAGVGEFSTPSSPFVAQDPWQKPGKPGKPQCSDVTGTSLLLNWKAPAENGGAEIVNYVIEYRKSGDLKWEPFPVSVTSAKLPEVERKLEKLTDDTEYEFRVAAENCAGRGPFSDPSDPCRTPIVGAPPVLASPLKDATVTAPETVTFQCDLDLGVPEATVHWYKDERELYPGDSKYDITTQDGVTSLRIRVDDVIEDDAMYRVVAKNKVGEISSEAKLTVYSK